MRCLQCDGQTKVRPGPVRYEGAGLAHVYLDGLEVRECAECGDVLVRIPRVEELHRRLAEGVATKEQRLSPDEIRFLRKYLGLSGQDLARRLKVRPETVSRWEHGKQSLRESVELALRLLALVEEPRATYAGEEVDRFATRESEPVSFLVQATSTSWSVPRVQPTEVATQA